MDVEFCRIEVLQMNLNMLRLCRIWPQKHETDEFYINARAFAVFPFLGFLTHCNGLHYFYNKYYGKKLEKIEYIEDAFMLVSDVVINYLIFCIILRRAEINALVLALGDFTNFGKPKNADRINKKIDFFVKLHWIYTCMGVFIYAAYGIWQTDECEQIRLKNNSLNVCGLMSNIWFPYDIDYFPLKQMILFFQVICTLGLLNIGSCSVSIVLASVEHLIIRIDHLLEILSTVFEESTNDKQRRRLLLCIKYHNYIIKLLEQMDHCFSPMMFIHISLSSMIVATVGYVFLFLLLLLLKSFASFMNNLWIL